ncbi:MAG: hypothetical protein ABL894_14485 [Hyphomicrobium sp.]
MKTRNIIVYIAALLLLSSQARAGCEPGDQLEVTGRVSQIYPNQAKSWVVVLNTLEGEVLTCFLRDLFGSETKNPSFHLVVESQPPPDCRAGRRVWTVLASNPSCEIAGRARSFD